MNLEIADLGKLDIIRKNISLKAVNPIGDGDQTQKTFPAGIHKDSMCGVFGCIATPTQWISVLCNDCVSKLKRK